MPSTLIIIIYVLISTAIGLLQVAAQNGMNIQAKDAEQEVYYIQTAKGLTHSIGNSHRIGPKSRPHRHPRPPSSIHKLPSSGTKHNNNPHRSSHKADHLDLELEVYGMSTIVSGMRNTVPGISLGYDLKKKGRGEDTAAADGGLKASVPYGGSPELWDDITDEPVYISLSVGDDFTPSILIHPSPSGNNNKDAASTETHLKAHFHTTTPKSKSKSNTITSFPNDPASADDHQQTYMEDIKPSLPRSIDDLIALGFYVEGELGADGHVIHKDQIQYQHQNQNDRRHRHGKGKWNSGLMMNGLGGGGVNGDMASARTEIGEWFGMGKEMFKMAMMSGQEGRIDIGQSKGEGRMDFELRRSLQQL